MVFYTVRMDERNMSQANFRKVMRSLASGVSIVATGIGPARRGMVVSAFSSLSMDPPSVIVSINKSAESHGEILRSRRFSVSVLGVEHVELATTFSGQDGSKGASRFTKGNWKLDGSEPPLLIDAVASMQCRVVGMHDFATHTIFIGLVSKMAAREESSALVYHEGGYACLKRLAA